MGRRRLLRCLVIFSVSNMVFWGGVCACAFFARGLINAVSLEGCKFVLSGNGEVLYFSVPSEQCRYVNYRSGVVRLMLDPLATQVLSEGGRDIKGSISVVAYVSKVDEGRELVDVRQSDLLWGDAKSGLYDDRGDKVHSFIGGDGGRVFVTWRGSMRRAWRLYRSGVQITYAYDVELGDPLLVDSSVVGFLNGIIEK